MGDERPSTADLAERETEQQDEQGGEARGDLGGELQERAEATGRDTESAQLQPLLVETRIEHYRARWSELQPRFVDEPRETVSEADSLVAELMQDLATSFNDARSKLEEQWSRGEDVSTEDLRVALQRYRSFFERLLTA
jgi:hypothetical protein